MSNILDKAKAHARRIAEQAFDLDITLKDPEGISATIKGLGTHHNTSVDTDGVLFNSPNIHITFHEDTLIAANSAYNYKKNGVPTLKGHTASFVDNLGTTHEYMIEETMPDRTVGLVVCMCQKYEKEAFDDLNK